MSKKEGNYSDLSLRGGSCSPAPIFFGVPTKQSPGMGRLLRQNQERLAATCSEAEQLQSLVLLDTDFTEHTEKDNFLKLFSVKISEIRGVHV